MSLDKNLFTLWMVPSETSPGDLDCIDPPSSEVIYRKRRRTAVKGPEYFWSLLDPVSEAMLATVTAPGATAKTKTITLHDPDVPVQLAFTGTVSFKWNFVWESHEFEWRKDSCYLIRKPDPPVQVAVTDPAKKGRPTSVQVLDYNLRRFEIEDRKGLEIVMLCALLTFTDYYEGHQKTSAPPVVVSPGSDTRRTGSLRDPGPTPGPTSPGPLSPPPPPVPRIQLSSDPSEIVVTEEGTIAEYANHCASVLADKDMLFIVIRSSSPDVVPRVVQIAQETKRLRHRADEDEEELYQYVTYDQEKDSQNAKKKTKRVIKLDDAPQPSARKDPSYKPLTTLTIHLSKIPMPELAPQAAPPSNRPRPSPAPSSNSPKPSRGRPHSRPSPSQTPKPPAPKQQPPRLQRPSPEPGRNGRHGRSSSVEPRPRPAGGQQQYPSQNPNNLSPNVSRPRPTSSYGSMNTASYSEPQYNPPPWVNGGGAPQMPTPRPVPPANPPQLPSQPQQQRPPQQPQQQQPAQQPSGSPSAMSVLGKLLSRI